MYYFCCEQPKDNKRGDFLFVISMLLFIVDTDENL